MSKTFLFWILDFGFWISRIPKSKIGVPSGPPKSKIVLLAMLVTPLVGLAAPGVASAQSAQGKGQPAQAGERKLKLNQVRSGAWPEVTLNMTLEGPDGKAVPDVQPGQFKVSEQGKPQALLDVQLGPARSVPLAVVLVLDVSGSMNAEGKLGQAKAAADAFLDSMKPEDSAALIAFNDKVRTVVQATNDRGALKAGVDSLQAGGETAIYDALYQATELLDPTPASKRRTIILLTDGADTGSRYGSAVAAEVARQAGALVYTIGLGPSANDGMLSALAEPSGGKYYKAPSAKDLDAIYKAISIELDSQLFLKYKSTTRLERSYQLIHVEVTYTSPTGQVITRQISYRPRVAAAVAPDTGGGPGLPPLQQSQQPQQSQPLEITLPRRLLNPDDGAEGQVGIGISITSRFYSLTAALLASLAALCGTVGLAFVMAPSLTSQRVARYVAGEVSIGKEEHVPGFVSRVLLPALENLGKRLASLSPKGYTDHVEELLTLTGPPYRLRLASFLGMQVALSVALMGVLVLWALATAPDMPAQWMLAGLLGAVMGVYFPYFWLKRKVTRRQRALLRALPGALDFLAINVEAGLGFDAAIAQVVQRWRNTLTDELALLLIDFQIGKARKDAWRELMLRTQVPELNTFVTAMLQNEQVGSSIGTLLRTQADQMRIRRRQAAEEAARTAPVKMLLPMVFFIFPGIFVVILGPAIPQFINTFANLTK